MLEQKPFQSAVWRVLFQRLADGPRKDPEYGNSERCDKSSHGFKGHGLHYANNA